MADVEIPRTWDAAIRWFLGGTIIFASGFEAVVLFWEGKFSLSFGSFAVAVCLIALLLNWERIKAKMPEATAALTGAVADARLWAIILVALAVAFRIPGPQSVLGDWIFALPLLIGLVLFFASWKYLKPPHKTEEASAGKVVAGPQKDPQTERDLLLLLDFAVYQTTVEFLDRLIAAAPAEIVKDPYNLDIDRYERAQKYVQHVRGQLSNTHRGMDFNSHLNQATHEAERYIKTVPQERLLAGIHTLDATRWVTANLQCYRASAFLTEEKKEVKQKLSNQRSGLIERFCLRNPK